MRQPSAFSWQIRWWPVLLVAGFITVVAFAVRAYVETGALFIPSVVGAAALWGAVVLLREWADMP